MKRRILVTGGAGFIGSHLCARLVDEGHDVICLDNLFTSRKENIARLLDRPNFEFVRHDVTVPILLEADEIFNLACPASPVHYQYNPIKTVKTSVIGIINVLGMARRMRARVLHTSTSEVYGDPEISPQTESYVGHVNPIGPRACYDEGKRCAETLCFDYKRTHDLDVRVVRIFNTYGPIMHPHDGRVISSMVVSAISGEDIYIHGDGTQTRSFCYVDDLVEVLIRFMRCEEIPSGPVNIGNPEEVSILQLAELVLELSKSDSKIEFLPSREDDPKQRRPDITRAREMLGWEPSVALRDGLKKTIDYFRSLDLADFRPPTDYPMHPLSGIVQQQP